MTTLNEVEQAETAATTAQANLPAEDADNYAEENTAAIELRLTATNLRALYNHQASSNDFDLGATDDEEFYIVTNDSEDKATTYHGSLRGSSGTADKEPVSLTTLADTRLSNASFLTHEGERYIWTTGNTYTFGGSKDYSYGSGYTVGISEATRSDYKTWDGTFPYDIIKPTSASCTVDTSDYKTYFTNLPSNNGEAPSDYDVGKITPVAGFFFRKPEFLPDKNFIEKDVGHKYSYHLGDLYDIGVHKNTNEVKITKNEHAFEDIGISENHSHVGLNAEFNAHGMDATLGIVGLEFDVNVQAVKMEASYTGLNFEYSSAIAKIEYENAGWSYRVLDRPEFKISDENIKTLTSKKIHTLSSQGVVIQVDISDEVEKQPEKVLGKDDKKGALVDSIFFLAWIRAVFGSVKNAETAFDNQIEGTDFNSSRKDETPPSPPTGTKKGYSRLDIDRDSIGFASFSKDAVAEKAAVAEKPEVPRSLTNPFGTKKVEKIPKIEGGPGKSIAEMMLSSKNRLTEFSLRDEASTLYQKKLNFTQHFGLDKGIYVTSHYGASDVTFRRIWFAESDAPAPVAPAGSIKTNNDLKKHTAGIEIQKATGNFSKMVLDAENNTLKVESQSAENKISSVTLDSTAASSIIISTKLSATNFVTETLSAKDNSYLLHVNESNAKLELVSDTATLSVKGKATQLELKDETATLIAKTTTIEADTKLLAKSAKVELVSNDISLGKIKVKPTEVTIPQSKVTIGSSAAKMEISPSGLSLKGAKYDVKATGPLSLAGGVIKIG